MAMKRYAKAIVERKNIQFDEWMEELRAQHEGAVPKDYVGRVAKQVLRKCDPKQFLLSHATIVASVDTYAPRGAKVGRQMNRGVQIDVRWPDFRIKPECHDIINNNGDAWERSLLLSTYRTFIGAHNYLEHIQLPELSKGFIVDAIARDLGKTAYIDILVATDRKHKQLVSDILSGQIDSMSMGCISLFTTCTRCGNVAADDSQLCPCVQYDGKGNWYVAEDGTRHPIAELIGHVSVPNSNQFIEASWVRNPAFRGAIRRNILNPDQQAVAAALTESKLIHEIRTMEALPEGLWSKAASTRLAQGQQDTSDPVEEQAPAQQDAGEDAGAQDAGGQQDAGQAQGGQGGQSQGGGQAAPDQTPEEKSLSELVDQAQKQLMEMIVKGLGEKLQPKPEDVGTVQAPVDLESGNASLVRASDAFGRALHKHFAHAPKLVRWAEKHHRIVHKGGIAGIRSAGMTPRDLIVLSWVEDRCKGRKYPDALYQVAMQVGPLSNFPSEQSFLAACKLQAGRELNVDEQNFLMRKGRIASVSNL